MSNVRRQMNPVPCALPGSSALDPQFVEGAVFADAYRVPVTQDGASVVDIFFAIFGHHPRWLKAVLLARHRVGSWLGLNAASTIEVLRPTKAASYRVGQNIGSWPIYFLSECELIAGRDNKHMDFRLSVLRQGTGQAACATISTVCLAHNRFGQVYMLLIAPFHKWGVQRLMRMAAREGRL